MHLGFYNFYRQYHQNRLFENSHAEIGDDLLYPFVNLRNRLRALGHECSTLDMAPLASFDRVVFLDFPTHFNSSFRQLKQAGRPPLYLFLFEGPAVRPDNWNRGNHTAFSKIFTWNPEWADGDRYIRFSMPHKLPDPEPYQPSTAERFCCVIAGQKYSWHSSELYSERVRAIRWFEQQHPQDLDLYGIGWDRWFFPGKLSPINFALQPLYRKFPWLPRPMLFPSYRGPIKRKREVLKRYRFSICYENSALPGWITEKMLDAMFAGTVPVYLGDPRVQEQIPPGTFVNKRDFPTYESLYTYLKTMPTEEYEQYRKNIHRFVHGPSIAPFGAEAFADLVIREIVKA